MTTSNTNIDHNNSHVIIKEVKGVFSGKTIALDIYTTTNTKIGTINYLSELCETLEEHFTEDQMCSMTAELHMNGESFELGTNESFIIDDLEAYTDLTYF